MALENLVGNNIYITNLVPSNPAGTDPVSEGDDHVRGTKNALLNSFPNINGPVTATPAQLNSIPTLAPLDSPAFTGNPTAPTPAVGDSDTSIATTAFVAAGISASQGGSNQSLAGNGYQKIGSLIIQWGSVAPDSATSGTVTFPIPFTTACYVVNVGTIKTSGGDQFCAFAKVIGLTNFTWQDGGNTAGLQWIAIGS